MLRTTFLAGSAAALIPRLARAAPSPAVSVAYAGSLVAFMEKALGPAFTATGTEFVGEAKGSTALANLIRDGLRTPDVFVSADTAAIASLFGDAGHHAARWYATFAAARMQIACAPASPNARVLADAAAGKMPWYEALATPGLRVARTDPAQDPKGYRVLLVAQLAERYYRIPGLARKLLGDAQNPEQILPEESAVARLETGDIDALWVYSTEAATRGYRVIDLPAEIDLGDPGKAADYARVSVDVAGKTYRGAPIAYALTIPSAARNAAGAEAFVLFLVGERGRDLERRAGLVPIPSVVGGDAAALPSGLRAALTASGPVATPSP